jgi:hypothetical protein
MASLQMDDDDIGTRLYHQPTSASRGKGGAPGAPSAAQAIQHRQFQQQLKNIDVRDEVDRMYNAILDSLDGGDSFTPPRPASARAAARRPASSGGRPSTTADQGAEGVNVDDYGVGGHAAVGRLNLTTLRSNTFGSARRKVLDRVEKTDGPGPGSYYGDDKTSRNRFGTASMSSTPRWRAPVSERGRGRTPGRRTKSGGERVIGELGAGAEVPGPGEYPAQSDFNAFKGRDRSRPSFSKAGLGRMDRYDTSCEETPGPGSYATDGATALRDPSPTRGTAGFGSSAARMPRQRSSSPGPGNYNTSEAVAALDNAPKASFSTASTKRLPSRRNAAPEDETPGPGTYNVVAATAIPQRDAKIRGVIPTSGRDDRVLGGKDKLSGNTPGPGSYDTTIGMPKGPSASIRGVVALPPSQAMTNPGPGTYNTATPVSTEGVALPRAQRFAEENTKHRAASEMPGPAEYAPHAHGEVTSDGQRVLGGVVPTAIRAVGETAKKGNAPGPGSYSPHDGATEAEPTAVFSTATRDTDMVAKDQIGAPGPGTYQLHDAATMAVSGAAVIGTSARMPDQKMGAANPGPGAYTVSDAVALDTGVAIGSAPRFHDDSKKDSANPNVGPATYTLPASDFEHADGSPGVTIGLQRRIVAPSELIPGPGTYEAGTVDAGLAVAFGTGDRFVKSKEDGANGEAPGPGAYQPAMPANGENAGGAVFGTAKRTVGDESAATELVGPGSYDVTGGDVAKQAGISVGMPTAERHTDAALRAAEREDQPGPGAYDAMRAAAAMAPHAPAAGMGTAVAHTNRAEPNADAPGPATYHLPSTLETNGGVMLGQTERFAAGGAFSGNADMPGPNAYFPQPVAAHVPGPTMSAVPLHDTDSAATAVPGPGTYQPQAVAPHAPAANFGTAAAGFNQLPHDADVPGPASYFVTEDGTTAAAQATFFPTSVRFEDLAVTDDTPGPGSYFPAAAKTADEQRAATFGTGGRSIEHGDAEQPGPGTYDPHATSAQVPSVVMYTAARMPEPAAASTEPGPTTYMPAGNAPPAGFAWTTDPRRPPAVTAAETPGPGAYHATPDVPQDNGPHAFFGSATRPVIDNMDNLTVPGPGTYTLPSAAAPQNIVLHGAPRAHGVTDDAPGPTTYFADDRVTQPEPRGISMPVDQRFAPGDAATAAAAPGPGQYNPAQLSDGIAYSVSLHRPLSPAKQDGPGPAAYAQVPIEQGSAAVIGTSMRPSDDPSTTGPGPAAYNPQLYSEKYARGPTVSIGPLPALKTTVPEAAPGPSTYNVVHASSEGPAYSVGIAQRFSEEKVNDGPGPATYRVETRNDAPAVGFTHAERLEPAASDVPGPAAYDLPVDPAFDGPSAVMLAANKPADVHRDVPGPGAYDNEVKPAHAGVTFTTTSHGTVAALEARHASSAPGPAHYDPFANHGLGTDVRAVAFGQSEKNRGAPTQTADGHDLQPGPAAYDPAEYHAIQERRLGHTFGGAVKNPVRAGDADAPNPTSYDISLADGALYARVPAAALVGRPAASTAKAEEPGPCHYDVAAPADSTGVQFTRAERIESAANDVPGPGAYPTTSAAADVPSPAYSFPRAQPLAPPTADVPGVGQYDLERALKVQHGGEAHTIPQAARDDAKATTSTMLGPGRYNVGAPPHDGPLYSFPQAEAPNLAMNGVPGPGYYSQTAGPNGQSAFFATGRPDEAARNTNPGPGEYNLVDYDPYRVGSPAMNMARTAVRPATGTVTAAGPGPGSYQVQQTWDHPGGMMGQRYFRPYFEATPGPPDYHPGVAVPAFHRNHSEAI